MYQEDIFISELNKKKNRAWRELYTEFYPALCSYANRITCDETLVEDIVQDCLVGLWDSPLNFPNVRALAAYLYRSVYHRSLNVVRHRIHTQKELNKLTHSGQDLPDEEIVVEWAIEETVVSKFRLVLTELSAQQQEVLSLSMEGLKVREIAEHLGVTENTVKMQKKRAYAEVRKRLGEVWSVLLIACFPHIF